MDRRTFLRTLAEVAGAATLAGVASPAWAAERSEEDPPPDRLRLAAVGDCILGRRFVESGDAEVRAVADLLQSADAAWGNYERVQPDPRADPLSALAGWPAAELRALGLRLVGTANNHTLDYGDDGLAATLESLDRAGIAHAGAGADLIQAARPSMCETPAGRVADVNCASTFPECFPASPPRSYRKGRSGINPLHLDATVQVDRELFARLKQVEAQLAKLEAASEAEALAGVPEGGRPPDLATVEGVTFQAGPGVERFAAPRPGDLTRLTQTIRSARQDARVVIASIHSHEARNVLEQPAAFLPRFARACIDAGADLFVGTGPHVLRGIELYKGRPIFYSLGNFIFHFYGEKVGFQKQRRFWQSVVPRLTWEGHRLAAVDLHPIALGFGQPAERRGTPRIGARRQSGGFPPGSQPLRGTPGGSREDPKRRHHRSAPWLFAG